MIVSKKGISRKGDKVSVFSKELCRKIRKRLGLTQKQLSNELISKVISLSNKETKKWLLENPPGFKVHRDMGYLAISKHLPKEFRDDKEEIVEKIKNLDKHPSFKEKLLRRYDVEIGRKPILAKLFSEGIYEPAIDYERFFYYYKVMWFNKRNCSIKKARVYKFEASREFKKELAVALSKNKEYYEYNFDDFYGRRLKPIE